MKKTILIFISLILLSNQIAGYAEDVADQKVDSELKTIWREMTNRLIEKDIEGALGYFAYSSRERYREQFSVIGDKLPMVFAGMRDIESVYIKDNEAKYRVRIKDASGEHSGYIWFRKDMFGRWKIERF
ncbi:MAG: hypothetical protein HZA12_01775 [Nitrospirae bacterium]|nr:hypothetical protein [Nitrospirota bacterium]